MASRILVAALAAMVPLTAQVFKLSKDQLIQITSKNPYGRFEDGRPNVPDAMLEKVRGMSVEECLGIRGDGYPNQYEGSWQILHPGKKLVGRVVTAQFMPQRLDLNELLMSDLKARSFRGAAHQWVIDQLQPGDIFVVDLFGKDEGGTVVGDNLATAVYSATKTGGIVVDGGVRDLEGIHPIGMQVYYRHAHPSAIGNVQLTGYNVPIRIGAATVFPGDLVLGDRTGIFFLPPNTLEKITGAAEETHIHDEWTKAKFMSGKFKSSELYPRPQDPTLRKEYEEYKAKKLGKQ